MGPFVYIYIYIGIYHSNKQIQNVLNNNLSDLISNESFIIMDQPVNVLKYRTIDKFMSMRSIINLLMLHGSSYTLHVIKVQTLIR